MFDLTGKVALISGGSRGLGRGFAAALASCGADLALVARGAEELRAAQEEISAEYGVDVLALQADVTVGEQVEAAVEQTVARFGRLDVLINNAGLNIRKPALELSAAEFAQVLDVNLNGCFLLAQAAGRRMVTQRYGRVINVGSVLGVVGATTVSAYASSKGAVSQLTKVLALEWAQYGVTVNCLAPAYFATELTKPLFEDPVRREFIQSRTPLGRWGEPEELYGAIVYLASDASSYMTGQTLFVDGGWLAW